MADQWDKIAQFAECIPGFTSFSKEDQEILLQVGKWAQTEPGECIYIKARLGKHSSEKLPDLV